MKITNKTRYATAPLRTIIRRVAKDALTVTQRKDIRICIMEPYRGRTKGNALGRWFAGGYIEIYLPKDTSRVCKEKFAHVVHHELAHSRGMKHKQMRGNPRYDWVDGWRDHVQEYVKGVEITMKQLTTKSKRKPTEDKLAHAAAMFEFWAKKMRRAETKMKTWGRKQQYYTRQVAAKMAEKEGE